MLENGVVICGPEEQVSWDTYIKRAPTANVCHQFLWRPVISRAYGHQPLYLMARSNGCVRGVLPLFLVKSRLFGKTLTSMPFLDYGGVCADDEAAAHLLLDKALDYAHEYGVDSVELRQYEPPAREGLLRLDKVGMRLDLSVGMDSIWHSFPAKVRNQVRKAEKAGLRAEVGGAELLDEFYPVFAVNMRDLGSPVHHRAFFSNIFVEFGQQARLVLVRDGRQAVGGLVCLFFRDTVTVPWASSLREYFAKCPNNLLYWEALRYSYERGARCFDFGRSSTDSGTYHFKRQWGATPKQIYWQTLGKNGHQSSGFSSTNRKYQMALALWKRLPVPLTLLLGPPIRKYITN